MPAAFPLQLRRRSQAAIVARAQPRLGTSRTARVRMAAELVCLFAILFAADHYFLTGNAFAGFNPNPYWLPVLTMAVGYGSGMGLASAVVASAIWLTAPHVREAGDHLEAMLAISLLPMLWVIVALALGELTTSRLDSATRAMRRNTLLEEEVLQLASTIEHLAQTNRALQVRIATEDNTVARAIAVAADLAGADPEERLHGVERLIALAAQTEDFSLYLSSGHEFVALLHGKAALKRPQRLDWSDLAESISAQPFGSGTARLSASGSKLCLPIFQPDDESLVGVLVLQDLPAQRLQAAKAAELTHVTQSLGRMAELLRMRGGAFATPDWSMPEGRAA